MISLVEILQEIEIGINPKTVLDLYNKLERTQVLGSKSDIELFDILAQAINVGVETEINFDKLEPASLLRLYKNLINFKNKYGIK